MGQSLVQTIKKGLRLNVGETSGDIPLYSLHRIKNRLAPENSVNVSAEIKNLLMRNLIEVNKIYKEESGNDWSCLTSANLVDAIELVDRALKETIEGLQDIPNEYKNSREALLKLFHASREQNIKIIQVWFQDNFDHLLYDMHGSIPWPVVRRLRSNLGLWIVGVSNPFAEGIEDMVLSVSEEAGITTEDAEEAWEKMGGKVFKKKKKK